MIPDWKLERYLTGDLPDSEMREIREMEATDEIFAGRVKMMREDNRAILKKMPFERLSERLDAMPARSGNGLKGAGSNGAGNGVSFTLVKFATAAARRALRLARKRDGGQAALRRRGVLPAFGPCRRNAFDDARKGERAFQRLRDARRLGRPLPGPLLQDAFFAQLLDELPDWDGGSDRCAKNGPPDCPRDGYRYRLVEVLNPPK